MAPMQDCRYVNPVANSSFGIRKWLSYGRSKDATTIIAKNSNGNTYAIYVIQRCNLPTLRCQLSEQGQINEQGGFSLNTFVCLCVCFFLHVSLVPNKRVYLFIWQAARLKFIYSEKVTKFCDNSTLLLSYVEPVKNKVKILQKFLAFSEYMNFNRELRVAINNKRLH